MFINISWHLQYLDAATIRAFSIREFLAGAKHHFFKGVLWV